MTSPSDKYQKLFEVLKENSRKDNAICVVNDQELQIKVPRSKAFIFILLLFSFASVLAIWNILKPQATVVSTVWILLMGLINFIAIREGGFRKYCMAYLKGLTTVRVFKVDYCDEEPTLSCGYKLWRYCIIDFQAKLTDIYCVSWIMGQGSSRAGEDTGDWFIGLHTRNVDRGNSFFINDSNLSRKECKKLGAAIVIFLLSKGVDLVQTGENCWQSDPVDTMKNDTFCDKVEIAESVEEMIFFREKSPSIFPGFVGVLLLCTGVHEPELLLFAYFFLFTFALCSCGFWAVIIALLLIFFKASTTITFVGLFLLPCLYKLIVERSKAKSFYEVFLQILTTKLVVVVVENSIMLFYKWGNYRYCFFKAVCTDVMEINGTAYPRRFCLHLLDREKSCEREFRLCVKKECEINRFTKWLLSHKVKLVKQINGWHAPHRDNDVDLYYTLVHRVQLLSA